MDYVVILKGHDGAQIGDAENYWDADRPWTLKQVVWNYWREFLANPKVIRFEVLDSKRKHIVELTREQFEAGASQYKINFFESGNVEWRPTGRSDFATAWSEELAMALAKEMVPHYPPATGFELDVRANVEYLGQPKRTLSDCIEFSLSCPLLRPSFGNPTLNVK